MTTGPGTQRLNASETARGLLAALANRTPAPPESTVEISTTAKHATKDGGAAARLHTWTITVRGEDVDECARRAQRLDDELAAKYGDELDADTLAGQLAASVVAQGAK